MSFSVCYEGQKQHQYEKRKGPSNMGDIVSGVLQGAIDNDEPPVKRAKLKELNVLAP